MVENEELIVPFVSTTSNMADFFTKPLAGEAFFRLRNSIMNLPPRSGSAARSSSATVAAPPPPVSPPRRARALRVSIVRGGSDV